MKSDVRSQDRTARKLLAQDAPPSATLAAMDRQVEPPEAVAVEAPPSRFRVWVVGLIVTLVLRARHVTWRRDMTDLTRFDELLSATPHVLAVFWHGKYVPLFTLMRGRSACVFASLSFRGAVIAEVCRRHGYNCVLLPYRGGKRSRAIMRAALQTSSAGAIAVDGPLGPNREVKSGAVEMASALGMAVVPVSAASSRKRVDRSRWDGMEVPRLFSRVALLVGEPFRIPPGLGPEDVLAWQEQVGEALAALESRAEEVERGWSAG